MAMAELGTALDFSTFLNPLDSTPQPELGTQPMSLDEQPFF